MPIKSRENLVSAWAFLIGVVVAILVGVFARNNTHPIVILFLAIIGLIVGIFVAEKDVQTFLFASVSLVLVSFAGIQGLIVRAAIQGIQIGTYVDAVLGTLLVMFVPATIVVALKTVFSLAKR